MNNLNEDQKLLLAGVASLAAVATLTLALGFFLPASAAEGEELPEQEQQPENQVIEAVPTMFHVRIMEDCMIEKSEELANLDGHAMVTYRIAPLASVEHIEPIRVNITANGNGTWTMSDDVAFYKANVTGMIASDMCVTSAIDGNHSFAGEFEPASFTMYRVEVPEGCEMDASEMPDRITLRQDAEGASAEGIELPEGCMIELKASYGVFYHYNLEKPIEEQELQEEE